MYMHPIAPTAPPVATQAPSTAPMPVTAMSANPGPKVGPFFTPANKPMDRNAVADQNQVR